MARRQLVLVVAWVKHERRRLDPRHHLFQRAGCRRPLAEVAVDAVEVLLKERALGAAQQALVDNLALTEHILKAV